MNEYTQELMFKDYLLIINTIFIIFLLIMNIINKIKLKKMTDKYYKFMNGLSDKNIEQLLEKCIERIELVEKNNENNLNSIKLIDKKLLQCIQKIGFVRYSAFENVGSELSFALALLDAKDDGVVINGIYTRESSATYSKAIENGVSKYKLSAEEIQAIDNAKKFHAEKLYYV